MSHQAGPNGDGSSYARNLKRLSVLNKPKLPWALKDVQAAVVNVQPAYRQMVDTPREAAYVACKIKNR